MNENEKECTRKIKMIVGTVKNIIFIYRKHSCKLNFMRPKSVRMEMYMSHIPKVDYIDILQYGKNMQFLRLSDPNFLTTMDEMYLCDISDIYTSRIGFSARDVEILLE